MRQLLLLQRSFFPGSIAMHSTRCGLLPLMLRALSVTTENATHETAAEMRKLLLWLAKMTVNGVISLHLKNDRCNEI